MRACIKRPALVTIVAIVLAACASSPEGTPCDSMSPCPPSFVCAMDYHGVTRCMLPCDLTETVCSNGEICLPVAVGGGGACYLGGPRLHQALCNQDLDCDRGDVCVRLGGLDPFCWYGCNLDHTSSCPVAGSQCTPSSPGSIIAYCD